MKNLSVEQHLVFESFNITLIQTAAAMKALKTKDRSMRQSCENPAQDWGLG